MRMFVVAALVMSVLPYAVPAGAETEKEKAAKLQQAAIVGAELSTIANQLGLRPESAIDYSKIGEYCFYLGSDKISGWRYHHTHYAIDPTKTQEDTIDFVDARPLLEAGVKLDGLPALPAELGKMTPGQWYFRPAGEPDPHHGGKAYDLPELVRASDLQ